MPATTIFARKGSTLATAMAASATSIAVTNAGVTGLDYTVGDNLRLFAKQALAVATPVAPIINNIDDANADGALALGVISGIDTWSAAAAAALAGSVIANTTKAALVENTDFVIDYSNGGFRFINPALTPGATYAIQFQYQQADTTAVNLGKFLPTLEFGVRLEHKYPDGRLLILECPRAAVTPDNPQLQFQENDWIGTDLNIEVLSSNEPADVNAPFGKFWVEHKASGQNSVGYDPDSYSVGSFYLYLTPIDEATAAYHGLPATRIDVGNVKVGSIDQQNEFLRHYRGTPRVKDKVVLIQKEMNLVATIENLNTTNLALLFDGEVIENATNAGFGDDMRLMTVPADIATNAGQTRWMPLGKIAINPA
jgi:hypothetical protein